MKYSLDRMGVDRCLRDTSVAFAKGVDAFE